MPGMVDHALDLCRLGLSVFPLRPRDKRPLGEWKSHQRRAMDLRGVSLAWAEHPDANIAIATGPISGVFVLDVDGEKGSEALASLQKTWGPLPPSWRCLTGRGEHIYFRWPEGRNARNSAGRLGEWLDTRGDGGYVVGPGSIHETGKVYAWDVDGDPAFVELADAPAWLLDLIDPPKKIDVERPRSASGAKIDADHPYVRAAVDRALEAVSRAAEGTRNDTLNREAFGLAGLVAAGALEDHAVAIALETAAVAAGLSVVEARATIRSGMGKGRLTPREIPEFDPGKTRRGKANGHDADGVVIEGQPDALGDALAEAEASGASPEYSDEYLALRFSVAHENEARFVSEWSRWMLWDGAAWRNDQTMTVWRWAREICRDAAIEADARQLKGKSIASAKTVAAVVGLARSDARHAAVVDQWDRDPWMLNTPEGVVDLRTGVLGPVDRLGYHSKTTAVAPRPGVPVTWLSFLSRVMGGDIELVGFLQRSCGYSLTGSTREEVFWFLHGSGQNGKTKFIECVAGLLGDYHARASVEAFAASKFEQHPADLAMLRGARMVSAVETEEGRRWAESRIKSITGGDQISARFMRQDYFTFVPVLKLWIAGNHKPGLKSVDKAIRRRLMFVPFLVTIPEEERDRELGAKLKAEWPMILNWMIEGCLAWQKFGLQVPQAVIDATEHYMDDEDIFNRWLQECCVLGRHERAGATALWQSWKGFAESLGEQPGSQKRLAQNLERFGLTPERNRTARQWLGISLKPSVDPYV